MLELEEAYFQKCRGIFLSGKDVYLLPVFLLHRRISVLIDLRQ